jgi:DNA repair protein RecN (Recombination protein N)
MLQRLHIRHFAIIDSLELELKSGLSVLTGETGAGKSILLDALGLILGDRAESNMIRTGQEKADVSAEFECPSSSSASQWLKAHDLEADEDDADSCLIRRVITKTGRSRTYINGQQCQLQQLKQLGEHLIDIHGQHAHHTLLKNNQQLELLDEYAKPVKSLRATSELYNEWQQAEKNYQELKTAARQRQTRLDFLQFQLKELDAVNITEEEFAELEKESTELSIGSKHLDALQNINVLLNEEDSATEMLGRATVQLRELAIKNTRFKDLAETLESADIQAREVADEISRQLDKVDADPEREDWLNDRLGAIQGLARKHRVTSEELFDFHQSTRDEYENLLNADNRLAQLEKELKASESVYRTAAKKLSTERNKSAKKLEKLITTSIRKLGMPDADFKIQIFFDPDKKPKPQGLDNIEFMFSANPGQNLEALKKIASGGELSRIGLALAVTSQSKKSAPVVIFDEVDAGIGGVTANTVGEYLQELGKDYQVLCVTHLAQVAAKANHQFRVMKITDGKTTHTQVRGLNKSERVTEIVRMLGSQDSDVELVKHAKKLLS